MVTEVIGGCSFSVVKIEESGSGCRLLSNCMGLNAANGLKDRIVEAYGDDYAMMIDLEVNDEYGGPENPLYDEGVKICGAGFNVVKF